MPVLQSDRYAISKAIAFIMVTTGSTKMTVPKNATLSVPRPKAFAITRGKTGSLVVSAGGGAGWPLGQRALTASLSVQYIETWG
jgi:hypothetical protein